MHLTYEPLDDATWPGPFTDEDDREFSRFRASWAATLADLDHEVDLAANGGKFHEPAVLEVPYPRNRIYRDGTGIHRDAAAPRHPGVALSFSIEGVGPVRFASDRYRTGNARGYLTGWQANVRGIVLTLEALRGVDRWGAVRREEQYRGWQALGDGSDSTAMGAGSGTTPEDAARALLAFANWPDPDGKVLAALVAGSPGTVARAYRDAARLHHPDAGGNADTFRLVGIARDLLTP